MEGEVEVRQEHPSHRQDRGDENELPREELAHGRVDRAVDHARKVHHGVHRREEGSVQPTATLANQIFDRLGNVGLCHGAFAVVHRPPLVQPGDNFETQNAVFGHVHVDETERGGGRAVQNVGNCVLKVLDRNGDLTEVGTVSRQLPADTNNGRLRRDGSDFDQNAVLALQMFGEGFEEPGVRVELPGVFLLQCEDHVDRRQQDLVHLRRHEDCAVEQVHLDLQT